LGHQRNQRPGNLLLVFFILAHAFNGEGFKSITKNQLSKEFVLKLLLMRELISLASSHWNTNLSRCFIAVIPPESRPLSNFRGALK
jgi:hypothetical protein